MKIICFIILLLGLVCNKANYNYKKNTCDIDYALNEVYYSANAKLTINITYHWFSDSIGEVDRKAIDSSIVILNQVLEDANIKFSIYNIEEIVNSDAKSDMPSYVKYARQYSNQKSLNVYIYSDIQNNYPEDKKSILDAAGGIPSTFCAIRKQGLKTTTIAHAILHCLSLRHIDSPDINPEGNSSRTGDLVCDTKAVEDLTGELTIDCLYTGPGNYSKEELKIITCNIMTSQYTKCKGCLTPGQIQRIKWVLEQSQDLRNTIKSVE